MLVTFHREVANRQHIAVDTVYFFPFLETVLLLPFLKDISEFVVIAFMYVLLTLEIHRQTFLHTKTSTVGVPEYTKLPPGRKYQQL